MSIEDSGLHSILVPNGQHLWEQDGRLTELLRKRRRPLLLVLDDENELVCSSLRDETASAYRLLDQALAEAKSLAAETQSEDVMKQLIVDKPGERCALVAIENELYTVRLFRLYTGGKDAGLHKSAALIEPVGGPLTEGIDFAKVKEAFRLSNREMDVLAILMSGSKDKEIARALGVSAGTVRAYLKSVRAKLRVTTRAGLVNRVHELSSETTTE